MSTQPDRQSPHQLWRRQRADFLVDARAACELARLANSAGEHLLALEISEATLGQTPASDETALRQQKALALARAGSTEEALATLDTLRARESDDPEALGMLGRIYKDLAEASTDPDQRSHLLATAQECYQAGFDRTGSTYCGINAAALCALRDDRELASRLAERVLEARGSGSDDFYDLATRAEASLIIGDEGTAGDLYRHASAHVGVRWADLASTRKQCRVLALKVYGRRDKFDTCFPDGAVAIFAGHLIDGPERPAPRLPASAEDGLRLRIERWLTANAVRWSFSSAACGADLIFLDVARSQRIETHVVLPYAVPDFIRSSVLRGGDSWIPRFEEAIANAASVTIVNDEVADDRSGAFDFSHRMVAAKATLRATSLDVPVRALAVWNFEPGDGRGGTADAVQAWRQARIATHVMHPTCEDRDGAVPDAMPAAAVPFESTRTALPAGYRTTICSVVHLYFASYFGLQENQRACFQLEILGALATQLAATEHAPASRYGLGADYVLVFDEVRRAGLCASEILRSLESIQSRLEGPLAELPRLCLHAGPVQLMVNPVLNQYAHEGATLTRAGRLARRLAPGTVFCTEQFASLSALDAVREFVFEYAGTAEHGVGDTQDRLFRIRYR